MLGSVCQRLSPMLLLSTAARLSRNPLAHPGTNAELHPRKSPSPSRASYGTQVQSEGFAEENPRDSRHGVKANTPPPKKNKKKKQEHPLSPKPDTRTSSSRKEELQRHTGPSNTMPQCPAIPSQIAVSHRYTSSRHTVRLRTTSSRQKITADSLNLTARDVDPPSEDGRSGERAGEREGSALDPLCPLPGQNIKH